MKPQKGHFMGWVSGFIVAGRKAALSNQHSAFGQET
jgi:hypothetical protein